MAGLNIKAGQVTAKGTKITTAHVDAVAADEAYLEIIADNTEQVLAAIPAAIGKALEAIGIMAEGHVVGYMTEHHIVDTGRLRNSITHTIDNGGKAAIVGTNVEYATYVHEGTHKMAGRPFLTATVTKHSKEYRDELEKHLKSS